MTAYLKAFFGAAFAAVGAAQAAYMQGHGHIGWQGGFAIALAGLSAFAVVWGVPNSSKK